MVYRFCICLLLVVLHCGNVHGTEYLFDNGKTLYEIVLPDNPSASEKTAARELQSYLRQISGVDFPISHQPHTDRKQVFVGISAPSSGKEYAADDEGFTYQQESGNIYIWGGRERGTMYGVFAFLENELGIRWYTPDCTRIPKCQTFKTEDIKRTESPAIRYRLDFYYQPLRHADWCAHNRLNENYSKKTNEYGGQTAIYGMHTAFKLVSPDKYFASHPEYYSLLNGRRQHKTGQLCLSNPDVIKIATQSVLQTIHDNPGYWAYDISQMDNPNYCQCKKCAELAARYGGQSGLMVWYVNQIAAEVKKKYPTVYLSTFAYLYTRQAPSNIVPAENVIVRLCDIECCFSHTLDDAGCTRNTAFCQDLKDWGKLTRNIYIWDYTVCFIGYLVPYPNFKVLADNIRFFAKNGVTGVLEEGAHSAQWGDFTELRQWLLARLLWNPDQDTDTLIQEFCTTYYGSAAPHVLQYLDLYQRQLKGEHVTYRQSPHYKRYAKKPFTTKAEPILQQALRQCEGDPVLQRRVNRLLAQVYFMQVASYGKDYAKSDAYNKLQRILKDDPTTLSEMYVDHNEILQKLGFT